MPASTALLLAFVLGVVVSLPALGRDVLAPAHPFGEANAASSLRTTSGDMARFMIEVINPRHIDPKILSRMTGETVPVSGQIEWGLGLGIRHNPAGDTLWHWGGAPGFQSLIVIDPKMRGGVVILTNSDAGAVLAQEIAAHVTGQTPGWGLP